MLLTNYRRLGIAAAAAPGSPTAGTCLLGGVPPQALYRPSMMHARLHAPPPPHPPRDVVEVNQFLDERQLRAAAAHRSSRASSRAGSRAASGIDLAQLQEQSGGGGDEADEQGDAMLANGGSGQNGVAAAPGAAAGQRSSGGRKKQVVARYQEVRQG